MLSFILQQLFTRPYYHLFVAGPSQQCSRLTFALSLIYGSLFIQAIVNAISNFLFYYLQKTDFIYHAFGFTRCRWQLLSYYRVPTFTPLVNTYLTTHGPTLTTFYFCVNLGSAVLILFLLWRTFMLILQRVNGTFIPPVVAAAITAAIIVFGLYQGTVSPHSLTAQVVVAWLFVLLVIPARTPLPHPTTNTEKWLIAPTHHAFSLAFRTPISGFNFALAWVAVFIIPGLLYIQTTLEYAKLRLLKVGILTHVDSLICNTTALNTPLMSPDPGRHAMRLLLSGLSIPSSIPDSIAYYTLPILPFIFILFIASFTSARLHALVPRYAWAWSLLLTTTTMLIRYILFTEGHPYIANLVTLAFILAITFIKPKNDTIPE